MTDEQPEGRIFGKGQLDEENKLAVLKARVTRLEDQTHFETSEDNARLRDLAQRIHNLDQVAGDQSDALIQLREFLVRLEKRFDRPSAGDEPSEPWEVWAGRQLEKMGSALGDHGRRLDSVEEVLARMLQSKEEARVERKRKLFSELYSSSSSETIRNAENQKYFEDGYQAGKIDALDEVNHRVQKYMSSRFSMGTIAGVVQAIRLSQLTPSGGFSEVDGVVKPQYVTDHVFRSNGSDRRHCSKITELGVCGRTAGEHVESKRPRPTDWRDRIDPDLHPIRDNPQA